MSAPRSGVSKLANVSIEGPAGDLEGLLQEHDGPATRIALVCHPHPLYGGTLHNKVVHRTAGTLHALGATVLRVNYRGVGKSAGSYDKGRGELEDARAALRWLTQRHPGVPRLIGGFSFGAWVAARLAAAEEDVERLILIAPPIHSQNFEAMHAARVPKVVIQGTADELCKAPRLAAEFPFWAEPKTLVWIEGAGHFFDAKLGELGEALQRELGGVAGG